MKFLREVKSPWLIHVYMEKFDRGQWNVALIDRQVSDMCQELQNPAMPWYFLTSLYKKKDCPYPAGHIETIVNGTVGELPDGVDRSLFGKYRFIGKSTFQVDLQAEQECFRGGFDVIE